MSDDSFGSDGPPSLFSSRGFVISAVTIGVITVMGVIVAATTLFGEGSSGAAPSSNEGQISEEEYPERGASASEVPLSDGSESICGLTASGGQDFTGFPSDTTWDFVGTMKAPAIPGHGPGKIEENGFRHCYAKTPEGVVLAAMNYVAMTNDPVLISDLVEHMYATGTGREAALQRLATAEPRTDNSRGRLEGVRLMAYGYDRARVDVALFASDGQTKGTSSVVIDLRWEQGDWKIVTDANGEMIIPMAPLDTLEGYIRTEVPE